MSFRGRKSFKRQAGIGLLSVMVAASIMSMLSYAVVTSINNEVKVAHRLKESMNLENLRLYFRARVDCVQTFAEAGARCNGQNINLLTATNQGLSSKTQQGGLLKIGKYYVKANCELVRGKNRRIASRKTIVISYKKRLNDRQDMRLFKDVQICEDII